MEIKHKKIVWTQHSLIKMKQYGLSKTKIIHIIHKPERVEDGIVPGTGAMMKTNKVFNNSTFKKSLRLDLKVRINPALLKLRRTKAPGEVWLMYKDSKEQRKIISCWRYPGITKPGEQIPIPEDIKIELLKNNF